MSCPLENSCGGCSWRHLSESDYQALKNERFKKCLSKLKIEDGKFNAPVFIPDGVRRRATFAFEYKKKKLTFGFNQKGSHQIVDIEKCPLLTPELNKSLQAIRTLVESRRKENYTEKKGKRLRTKAVSAGDVFVCAADNGIDVVLEYDAELPLAHRLVISETIAAEDKIIRVSHRRTPMDEAETIVEKLRPIIHIGNYEVSIPAGTFLQPSKAGQEALSSLVLSYLKDIKGQVADLFCGVGTFSYVLAGLSGVKITAADSSKALLKGFQDSLNRNCLTNVRVENKNLFKYPYTENELKNFEAVVFDPPRAGAKALCAELAKCGGKPEIIVAVSCNPETFVNDAGQLISGGWRLKEITMVDQFVYSDHSELVACFTKEKI